jgi:uncharacterized DUF497 family protein
MTHFKGAQYLHVDGLDEAKREQNLRDHKFDFADARDRFEWETAVITPSHPADDGRARFKAIGVLDGRLVGLVFSALGTEAVSAISLRPANRSERKRYVER